MLQYRPLDRTTIVLVGARLMAGRLTLDQLVVVQIHCPQLENTA